MVPAVALLEFDSIAAGIAAGDAMVKRAPLDHLYAGTVQPGKYLVLVAGDTASVEEAIDSGTAEGADALVDLVFLPDIHRSVVTAIGGERRRDPDEALGVVETRTVAATIAAADAGVKGAAVTVLDVYLADGLGGKAYVLFGGPVAEVEAAVEIALSRVGDDQLAGHSVIAQLHDDMAANLEAAGRFRKRARNLKGED